MASLTPAAHQSYRGFRPRSSRKRNSGQRCPPIDVGAVALARLSDCVGDSRGVPTVFFCGLIGNDWHLVLVIYCFLSRRSFVAFNRDSRRLGGVHGRYVTELGNPVAD